MIPLGMPSLIEAPDPRSSFAIAVRLGLDFIELNMNLPEYQPETLDATLRGGKPLHRRDRNQDAGGAGALCARRKSVDRQDF